VKSGRGPLNPKHLGRRLPHPPGEEPELPLSQALIIAVLLWIGLGVLFLWGVYWFW
jgi:hypothetical protein